MTNAASMPRLLSLYALLLFLAVRSVWALDPSQPMSSYIRTHFSEADGLPGLIIDNIVQSRDGFLWATVNRDALIRFDGRYFTLFEQARGMRALALAPDGDLWVGIEGDLDKIPGAALNETGRVLATTPYHPGPDRRHLITNLHLSRKGILWVGTTDGLYRFDNGVFSPVIPKPYINRIEEASNGHLLMVTSEGFVEWDGSQVIPHP